MKKLIWSILAIMFCTVSAQAHIYIKNDKGGLLDKYIAKYKKLNVRGEKIVISGYCNSSCTLLLGIIPRERVCVRPGATLGFHSSYLWPWFYYAEGTREMWSYYPDDVRGLIIDKGWDGLSKHKQIIPIDGDLIYQRCQ